MYSLSPSHSLINSCTQIIFRHLCVWLYQNQFMFLSIGLFLFISLSYIDQNFVEIPPKLYVIPRANNTRKKNLPEGDNYHSGEVLSRLVNNNKVKVAVITVFVICITEQKNHL